MISNIKFMETHDSIGYIYEFFIRKAYKCDRFDYISANVGIISFLNEVYKKYDRTHSIEDALEYGICLGQASGFVICAIETILNNGEIDSNVIKELNNCKNKADEISTKEDLFNIIIDAARICGITK